MSTTGATSTRDDKILAGQCRIHGVRLLDPGAVTIAGVRFIGATLWTDFRLDGIANEPGAHAEAQRRISDFNGAIRQREGTRRFTTFESVRRHEAERVFIECELTGNLRSRPPVSEGSVETTGNRIVDCLHPTTMMGGSETDGTAGLNSGRTACGSLPLATAEPSLDAVPCAS